MFEFIRNINGSDFLFYFPIYNIILIIVGKKILNIIDNSRKNTICKEDLSINELFFLSPIYSKNDVLEYTLIKMYKKNIIKISTENNSRENKTIILLENMDDNSIKSDIEQFIYSLLTKTGSLDIKELKNNQHLLSIISKIKKYTIKSLKNKKLKHGFLTIIMSWFLCLISLFPAIIKLIMGITYNKPVLYLIIEILLFSAISIIVFYIHITDNTLLGKDMINSIKHDFDSVYNNEIKVIKKIKTNLKKDLDFLELLYIFYGISYIKNISSLSDFATKCHKSLNDTSKGYDNSSMISSAFILGNDDFDNDSSGCSGCGGSGCSGCSGCGGCGGCGGGSD